MNKIVAILPIALTLCGCSTFSFAPPQLDQTRKIDNVDSATCTNTVATVAKGHGSEDVRITPDVIGAMDLVQNFELIYSCAADEASNGRQIFEIPSYLATALGLSGSLFGLNANEVLATGASAAVLKGGQNYYSPAQKAAIIGKALRAVNCVRTESVGISFFRDREHNPQADPSAEIVRLLEKIEASKKDEATLSAKSAALATAEKSMVDKKIDIERSVQEALSARIVALSRRATRASVEINAERQYFEMVKGALRGIHGILGERLATVGSASFDDIWAKLKELTAQEAEQKAAVKEALETERNQASTFVKAAGGATEPVELQRLQKLREETVKLEIAEVRTKLQICVLQARS